MLVLIAIFLIASFFVMLSKLGLMTNIKFKQITLSKSRIVYTKFKDSYEIINTKVQ